MWNNLDLECPHDDYCEYQPQEQYLIEDLHNFIPVLRTAARSLTSEDLICAELKALKDIQRKYTHIFCCDEFLVPMHRVVTCTKKMILLNLSKCYLDLAKRFLIQFENSSLTWWLPSQQQLEYLLIRTLSALTLVCQGVKYSRKAFRFVLQKLKARYRIINLVMAASLIARLHVLFRATMEQLFSMYQKVQKWRYKLKPGNFKWTQKPDLPHNLREWVENSQYKSIKTLPVSNVEALSTRLKSESKKIELKDSNSGSLVISDEVVEIEDAIVEIPNSAADIEHGELILGKVMNNHQLPSESQMSDLSQDFREHLECSESASSEILSMPNTTIEVLSTQLKSEDNEIKRKDSDSGSVIAEELVEIEDAVIEIPSNVADIDDREVIPIKEVHKRYQLTCEQIQLLQKIMQLESIKELENMWGIIQNFPKGYLPKILRNRKKRIINNMFSQAKAVIPFKKFNERKLVKKVTIVFCKHLGFTQNDIKTCKNNPCVQTMLDNRCEGEESQKGSILEIKTSLTFAESEVDTAVLVPVKTFKELKELYNRLCERHKNDTAKLCKLKKLFKRKKADIFLMKESGEKLTAKKLIFCTSKLLLARYEK